MKANYNTSTPIIINFCFKIGLLLRLLRKSTTNTKNKYKYLIAYNIDNKKRVKILKADAY